MLSDEMASEFEKLMMQRQKTEIELRNAGMATGLGQQAKPDLAGWILSCQSIHLDDLERFYAFVSEEVKTANVNDVDFNLCRIFREQAMNFYYMSIPNAYHQDLGACPERYLMKATQDASFREILLKSIHYIQLTKARNGRYIDALTVNNMKITSATPEDKRKGFWQSLFKKG